MPFELIVSQGRIADRSPGAIHGAALAADTLSAMTGLAQKRVGTASPPKNDDWSSSLPEARETLEELQRSICEAIARGNTPLIVANTCSASLATLPVVAQAHPDATILWIDAHGDFNTPETTETGYLGGMVLAAACGLWESGHGSGIDPARVVIVGARDIDPPESELLRQAGVRVVSSVEASPKMVLPMIGDAPVWIHVDWDVLEPGFVPAAYAIPGGPLPETLRAIFEAIPGDRIVGIELAEFESSSDEDANAASLAYLAHAVAPLIAPR